MKETKGYLPRSTSCCWSLRKNMAEFCHIQYFVDIDHGYVCDISSPLLSDNNNVQKIFFLECLVYLEFNLFIFLSI